MTTTRRRLAAIVTAFALVFALGVAWLVRTATADTTSRTSADRGTDRTSQTSTDAAGDTTPRTGAGAGGDTSTSETDGTRPGGGSGPGGSGPGGSGPDAGPDAGGQANSSGPPRPGSGPDGRTDENAVPPPARTVRVNGPLGGGPMDDSCRFFINPFEVALTVRSVSLASADTGLILDHAHCPASSFTSVIKDLKPCQPGATVAVGGACYTGAELVPEKRLVPGSGEPFQEYSARVTLSFTARCVSADVTPCSQDKVAQRAPSASKPVEIEWTATSDARVVTLGKREQPEEPEPNPDESSAGPAQSSAPASTSP